MSFSYACRALDCISHILQTFVAPPSAVRITDSGLNSRAVGLSGYVTLYCSSSSTSPSYKWYHNGSYISGTYQYTISYAQFRSAGLYRCEVSNIVGMDSGTYQLRVQGMRMLCNVHACKCIYIPVHCCNSGLYVLNCMALSVICRVTSHKKLLLRV